MIDIEDRSFQPLARALARYEKRASVRAVAGLLTVPNLATATIRLETLVNLACIHCKGTRAPSPGNLRTWVNDSLGRHYIARLEDPAEDVFISSVATPGGNYRIFESTWEANDWYLQHALDALRAQPRRPESRALIREIRAMLALSDAVCERRGLQRWEIAQDGFLSPRRDILPKGFDHEALAASVTFSDQDLQSLAIKYSDIERFVVPEPTPPKDDRGAPPLENRPLVRFGSGELVIACPGSVSAALRARILDWTNQDGILREFETTVRDQQWNEILAECRRGSSDRSATLLASLPPLNPALHADETVIAFDTDKTAHLILLHDNLVEAAEGRIADNAPDSAEKQGILDNRITTVATALHETNRGGGLTVVVGGGLGRGGLLAGPRFPSTLWFAAADSAHNLVNLLREPEWDLLRVWRMLWQESAVESLGMNFWNPYGLLTTASFWRHFGYSMIPRSMAFPPIEGGGSIMIQPNFILSWRRERRREDDLHAVPVDGAGHSTVVRRLSVRSHFQTMNDRPVYAAFEPLKRGILAGVIEAAPIVCWVITRSRPGSGDFEYQLWEAAVEWLDQCLSFLAPRMNAQADPIHVDLVIEGNRAWDGSTFNELLAQEAKAPESELIMQQRRIVVRLSEGFLVLLTREENEGERALLRSIVEHFPALLPTPADIGWDVEGILDKTFGGKHARKLHLFQAHSPAESLGRTWRGKPLLAAPEDRAFCELGLAWRTTQPKGIAQEEESLLLTERRESILFLREAVDALWHDMQLAMKTISREGLILAALNNVDMVHGERDWWRRTSRALASMPSVGAEAVRVAREQESARAIAASASRIIVEIAVCESDALKRETVSKATLGTLIASAATLIELATDVDALSASDASLPGSVRVSPNGWIEVDLPWLEEVAAPYTQASFAVDFQKAAAAYGSHLARQPDQQRPVSTADRHDDEPTPYDEPGFVAAFREEYGLTPREFVDVVAELIDWANERDQWTYTVLRGTLAARLAARRDFDSHKTNAFLRSFALSPRDRWDEAPAGYKDVDWYPWRFRRRLSLVARPLVQLDEGTGDDVRIVVCIQQCISSLSYLIEGLGAGLFQQEFVISKTMRRYLGATTDARGKAFTERVAGICQAADWHAETEVPMTQFQAPQELGDLDVVAWREGDPRLLCIECKRLRPTRTVAEMLEILSQFRGNAKDRLGRHVRRIDWITTHLAQVSRGLGAELSDLNVTPLMVTNVVVPMQFVADLPLGSDSIVTADMFEALLKR